MAWIFGDSFDLYAATADMTLGYWDSGTLNVAINNANGRFQARGSISNGSGGGLSLVKSSGSNDAVHHIVVAFMQSATISGSSLGFNFQLQDGTTTQCSIVFRSDGAILLVSGGPLGTVLATYSGAFTAVNTWYAFEIEVVINNTTGSMTVRKNGNTGTADFTLGSLNTRTTANNYANRLAISGQSIVSQQFFDDLLWRSDPSSVAWVGDIRCYARMPVSDQSVQFSKSPTSMVYSINNGTNTFGGVSANQIWFVPFVAPPGSTGLTQSLVINSGSGITSNVNMAIYDATGSGGAPGNLIATATPLALLAIGNNTFTFSSPPTLTPGANYYAALIASSALANCWYGAVNISGGYTQAFTYSSGTFPATATPVVQTSHNGGNWLSINATPLNENLVNEAQQDGATTYVFDSTVGHADFYGIASIPVTPVATIVVTTRGFVEKSDAGARSGAVQLKSGSSTVTSPSTALATSWGWLWRTDVNDPATSAPWTATGVNNAQIGPSVTA